MSNISTGKKIGFLALAFTPFIGSIVIQIPTVVLAMLAYTVVNLVTGSEINSAYDFLQDSNFLCINQVIFELAMILIAGIVYYFCFVRKKSHGEWKKAMRGTYILCIIVLAVAMQFFIGYILEIVLPLFPNIMNNYMELMEMIGEENVIMVISVAILAPIAEELIYRGLTYKIITKAFSYKVAIILQAVLFGVFHMNIVQGVYATLIGLIFGVVMHRYNSILPCIMLHIAFNSLSYAMNMVPVYENIWIQVGILLVSGIVSALCLMGLFKGKKPQQDMVEKVEE